MLIVKMMNGDNAPDEDKRSTYSIHADILTVIFERPPGADRPTVTLVDHRMESSTYGVFGNVYVMNEAGKTIDSFGPAPLDPEV